MRGTVALSVLCGTLTLTPLSAASRQAGGTFRIAEPAAYVDTIDGALAGGAGDLPWFSTACGSLMHPSDKPLPSGFRTVPELAAGPPKISPDGKTYVFTIRKDARFSTGSPVTAADVAFTINRILDPSLKSPYSFFFRPVVGAQAVLDGKATGASGITTSGRTLTIRLTRPDGGFVEGAASNLCVLPAGLPIDPQGVTAPVPSAAPYYISEYVPAQRIVLDRNPYYQGPRPQHVDRFVFDLTVDDAKAIADAVDGTADYARVPNNSYTTEAPSLVQRFGVDRSRFFVRPSTFLRMFALNTSRPLLRDNAPLRQAISYAIERTTLIRQFEGRYGGTPVDQFLPPIMPGFTDAHVYPLAKPDLAKARALAKGETRSGKLLLYIVANRPTLAAVAQVVKQDLARIGLQVQIRSFPISLYFRKLATPDEPFDMAFVGFDFNTPDPGAVLNGLFDGGLIGTASNVDWSYFNSPKWNRLLRQANRLTGQARYRAYGKLDVELARDEAPAVVYGVDNTLTLVSARTGCIVTNPDLDLAAVCLKQ
jgi:peptide/nickel transport system substrate-binding protein